LSRRPFAVIVNAYIGAVMVNHPPATSRFWLIGATVVARLEERHLTHADVADALGLSRSYWSQLVHRKRSLSPQVRRAPLAPGENALTLIARDRGGVVVGRDDVVVTSTP
jgi:hypothetical protein